MKENQISQQRQQQNGTGKNLQFRRCQKRFRPVGRWPLPKPGGGAQPNHCQAQQDPHPNVLRQWKCKDGVEIIERRLGRKPRPDGRGMLPSQDAMIFSIATSVRLYAICNPLLEHPLQYLAGIGAKFGVINGHLVTQGLFNKLGRQPCLIRRLPQARAGLRHTPLVRCPWRRLQPAIRHRSRDQRDVAGPALRRFR